MHNICKKYIYLDIFVSFVQDLAMNLSNIHDKLIAKIETAIEKDDFEKAERFC